MERLTYKYSVGENTDWEVHGVDGTDCWEVCQDAGRKGCEGCPIHEAIVRLAAYEETGLAPGDIANWIYHSINSPDREFEKTIRAVESALGFKLFVWQKTYIAYGEFRQYGATTAKVLRDLLDVSAVPIDYSERETSDLERFYRRELRDIKTRLDSAGVPTRTVFFSKNDKYLFFSK